MPVKKKLRYHGDVMVLRLDNKKFAIAGVEEEELSKRELIFFLNKVCAIDVYELAFCFESFQANPHHRVAHFGGVNGTFLYSS